MIYCPQCGKELQDDAAFCDRCGHKMGEPVSPADGRWRGWRADRIERRVERATRTDYLDGVGFGVFIIAVAWVYLQYPWVGTELVAWFQTWVNGPTYLPVILVEPIFLFFIIMGVWGIAEGGLRMISGRISRGLGNVVSGLGNLAIAYLIRSYGQGLIGASGLLPGFVIIIGASIVLSAILSSFAWSPRRD
jgi:hypothetical protein